MKLSETERVIQDEVIDDSDIQGYLLNLLSFYARACKYNGRYSSDKELEKNIKDLFGLVRAGKYDINKSPFKFLNIIGMATLEYRDALDRMKRMNVDFGNKVVEAIDSQLAKSNGEVLEKYTPKEMHSFNLYWNKHMMEEYRFTPKVRALVYSLIDKEITDKVKENSKSIPLVVETNNFKVSFIAKVSDGVRLYRITKIEKKNI